MAENDIPKLFVNAEPGANNGVRSLVVVFFGERTFGTHATNLDDALRCIREAMTTVETTKGRCYQIRGHFIYAI